MTTIADIEDFLKGTGAELKVYYDPAYSRWIVGILPHAKYAFGYGEAGDLITAIGNAMKMHRDDQRARGKHTTAKASAQEDQQS